MRIFLKLFNNYKKLNNSPTDSLTTTKTKYKMSSFMHRKNLGGLTITTTKNTISITDDSFDSPVRFDALKYLHFMKTNEIYLFTNSINDLFALFLYDKKAYYVLIQRNVNQLHIFQEDKFLYVIGIYHNITIYSFEKILNKLMDTALNEEIDEITAMPGSPKKNVVRVPFEDMCILSRSISPTQNSVELYENFLVIRSDVIQMLDLQEITILHLQSFSSYFFRIEKVRSQLLYNNNIFSFFGNEGELKNTIFIVTYFDNSDDGCEPSPGNIRLIMKMKNEGGAPHFKTATLQLHN